MRESLIPIEYLERIRFAHARGVELLAASGVDRNEIEPVDVALICESHRWAWKPATVRIMLVAESHVFTSEEERRTRVQATYLPANIPTEFVRLVYCLGSGESRLLDTKLTRPNGGTWQYWKLFGELAGTDPYPRKNSLTLHKHLDWKIHTLRRLQDAGIWLLDASFHAAYRSSRGRTESEIVQRHHDIWWDEYGSFLRNEFRPQIIWCIGLSVFERLGRKMGCHNDSWIYQPNARVTRSKHRERLENLLRVGQTG